MSISYELAKNLKDAGFPQVFRARAVYFEVDEPRIVKVCNPHDSSDTTNLIIAPALSELIEACGDEFISLHKMVHARELNWKCDGRKTKTNLWHIFGSTPEEAVSLLWLELHKK